MAGRWPTWVVAPVLAAPLIALTAWVAHGVVALPKTRDVQMGDPMADRRAQIGFRVSPTLHRQLKNENERTDVPIQKIIERALVEYFKKKKRGA